MADELFVQEEASQIRVAVEADTVHVPHFALEPIGDRPEPAGRRHGGRVLFDGDLEPHPVMVAHGIQMIDDVEARPVLAPRILEIVHRREVHEHVEAEVRFVAAEAERVDDAFRCDHGRVVPVTLVRVEHPRAEAPAQPREDGRSLHGWS